MKPTESQASWLGVLQTTLDLLKEDACPSNVLLQSATMRFALLRLESGANQAVQDARRMPTGGDSSHATAQTARQAMKDSHNPWEAARHE